MTNYYPAIDTDDSYEVGSANSPTSNPLQVRANATPRYTAFRLQLTGINQGDNIASAIPHCYFTHSARDDIRVDIVGEKVTSPATFTNAADHITTRLAANPTTASVEWQNIGSGVGWYVGPDIATVIQEQVDQASWPDEGYIVLFLDPSAYTSGEFGWIDSFGGTNPWYIDITVGATNDPPTIVPNTPDAITLDTTPTLEATGSDPDTDDLTYAFQTTNNPDSFTAGPEVEDAFETGGGGLTIHPNIVTGTTWAGDPKMDDRPGQAFEGNGGLLDKVSFRLSDFRAATAGDAYIRIYTHSGVYGTSSAPANAAAPDDTPTPDWLAISDPIPLNGALTTDWYDFDFTGSNKIRLVEGTYYLAVLDWVPDDSDSDNTFGVMGDSLNSGSLHGGNNYIDGQSAPNNGVHDTWDLYFRVYEEYTLLDKLSDTDSGFDNTVTPADLDPFNSGAKISFTVPPGEGLLTGLTYYWHFRAKDPSGSDTWSDWTPTRSFDVGVDLTRPYRHGFVLFQTPGIV